MKRVTEPVRKSLLDVIRKNLRAAGKVSYITRVVYVGAYIGTDTSIEKKMKSIIQDLQADYMNNSISGLFLIYPDYYVHALEAPEDIIYRHFKVLYNNQTEDCKIGKAIFLPTYHHVHQRFFTGWYHAYIIPPTLIQPLKSYELDDIQQQMLNCFNKVYMLCDHISNTHHDRSVSIQEVIRSLSDKLTRLYPESTLLEYLLNAESPVILTVEEYLNIYSTVPFINLYSGNNIICINCLLIIYE
ncbi:uncharacterized protein LOC126871990 [Bombus huntii]|uniref:uncharacterized protein LOC126871990 n=1 Tax=Bombus huntii TaxID=85661 RepID=UPI0021AAFFF5|nr:uncharacterized protein LOC126871990 [Bombus huntii]